MEEYQIRIKEEWADLQLKVMKLTDFLSSEKFTTLDEIDQGLLRQQLSAMMEYEEILEERMARF